jgi:hypothetical protein
MADGNQFHGRSVWVEITPLVQNSCLPGRICGAVAAEATPGNPTDLLGGFIRGGDWMKSSGPNKPLSQEDLAALEKQMRGIALSESRVVLLGLNAQPAVEQSSGGLTSFLSPVPGAAVGGGGIHQLLSFPISRFNGVPLPADSRIRFGDPSRWLKGLPETRMFTVEIGGTRKFYSWDGHAPVGNKPHAFYHVNHKGTTAMFGHTEHAALSGTALVQAKQMRYLKMGGRLFLVVGVVVDGVQLGAAAQQSAREKSVKPIAAQSVRTAGGWATAWAGAKVGLAAGALAGVETGPGLVLTAIGGGMIGGLAGYWGADWIADWIYEN